MSAGGVLPVSEADAPGADRKRGAAAWVADLVALLALLRLGALYLTRLDAWRINDDEGSYLYAAWRIASGELPYRDFLTPQLPAFLLPGGWLMRLTGPSDHSARLAMALLTLLAAVALWWAVRRLHGPIVAALAGSLLLLHPDVFASGRTFRSEPVMLLFIALGTAAFLRGAFPRPAADDPPDRRWLALAGGLFGLATLAKLFGPFPLAGLLLWLLDDARRRRRPWPAALRDVAATLAPCFLVVAAGLGGFALLSDAVYEATVDHHLRQGGGQSPWQILSGGLDMLAVTVRDAGRAVPIVVAVAVALTAWRQEDRRALAWGWQLPVVLVLLLMSRERYPRHLLFLTPALATLFALGLHKLFTHAQREKGRSGASPPGSGDTLLPRALAVALALGVLSSWFLHDRDYSWAREEDGTQRAGDLAALLTTPEQIVLSDYSELNFYALRPTTYSAASLSSGAVRSGQISWDRLSKELDALGQQPALVLLEADSPESHLAQLAGEDRAAFEEWLATEYSVHGTLQRGPQRYRVFRPVDPEADASAWRARFAGGPTLLAAEAWAESRRFEGGTRVISRSAWWRHGDAPLSDDLVLTLRLVDGTGRVWQQSDGPLLASTERPTTEWRNDELTSQRLTLDVPAGAPPGRYELRLGLYPRNENGELSATDSEGRHLGTFVAIGAIDVSAWRPRSDAAARRRLAMDAPPGDVRVGEWSLVGVAPWPDERTDEGGSGSETPNAETDAPPADQAEGLPSLTCGDVLELDTAWRRSPSMTVADDPDPLAELSLADSSRGVVAASLAQPIIPTGLGDPTGWPVGTTIKRRLRAPVRPGAAGQHALSLRSGPGGEPVELGEIEVRACTRDDLRFEDPGLARRLDVELGAVGTLIGVDAPDRAVQGGAIEIALAWRAVAPSETPLQVTVQLLDSKGRPVAAHDGAPGGGRRPTSVWLSDEVVLDRHVLELPDQIGATSGPGDAAYRLVVALYHPSTGSRLPVTGGQAEEVAPGLIEIGNVILTAPGSSSASDTP